MRVTKAAARGAVALAAVLSFAITADAKCTRLAFSVNDYGKDGPTKDAQSLLDKYIAKSMAERGIKSYTTGKKDVSCELFLNFIVFDEHTCKAEATVCWADNGGPAAPLTPAAAKPGSASVKPVTETATIAAKPAAAAPTAKKAPTATAAKPAPAAAPTAPAPAASALPLAPETKGQ